MGRKADRGVARQLIVVAKFQPDSLHPGHLARAQRDHEFVDMVGREKGEQVGVVEYEVGLRMHLAVDPEKG